MSEDKGANYTPHSEDLCFSLHDLFQVPDEFTGAVVDLLSRRKGEMLNMSPVESGGDAQTTSIEYLVPTRGMIGLRNSMLTATRGTAVMDTIFDSYRPYAGKLVNGARSTCEALRICEPSRRGTR